MSGRGQNFNGYRSFGKCPRRSRRTRRPAYDMQSRHYEHAQRPEVFQNLHTKPYGHYQPRCHSLSMDAAQYQLYPNTASPSSAPLTQNDLQQCQSKQKHPSPVGKHQQHEHTNPQRPKTQQSSFHNHQTLQQQCPLKKSTSQPSQVPQQKLKVKSVLSKEEANDQRVKITVERVMPYVMLKTFEKGAPRKRHNETLEDYLINKIGITKTRFKTVFNNIQRDIIKKDKSCKEFDVTLLFLAIQCGCENISPHKSNDWNDFPRTLEGHLKVIKDTRNTLAHSIRHLSDEEFHNEIEGIRKLLIGTLDLLKVRYRISESEIKDMIQDVTFKLNEIKDLPLEQHDLLLETLKDIVEREGIPDLERGFTALSYVNPAAQLVGNDIQIPIDKVYTDLKVVNNGRYRIKQNIDNANFLQSVKLMDTNPGVTVHVIIIEGVAGSGKTTMIKMVINDWLSGKKTGDYKVMTLDSYKLIIPLQCRDTNHSSLKSLISSLMPTARKAFHEEQLMVDCVLDVPTLFIVDGLDELNLNSKKILNEIVSLKMLNTSAVICTTRPGSIEDCYRMLPSNVNPLHLRIDGVPSDLRESFVRKYHDQLKAMKKSFQNTDKLIKFLKSTGARLKDHWTLPLNLTLLSLLWAVNSDKINLITTPAELFEAIHYLIVEKLLERLNYTSKLSIQLLKDRVVVFLSILYREAFFGIHQNNLVLPNEAVSRLIKQCETLELSSHELLGAFLVQRNSWSAMGITFELSFAHKSAQEYYGARYIYGQMFTQESLIPQNMAQMVMSHFLANGMPADLLSDITSLIHKREARKLKGVSEVLKETFNTSIGSKDTNKFYNTIRMLIGVIYMEEANDYDEELTKELVEVPSLLDTNITINDEDVWDMSILTANNIPTSVEIEISGAPTESLVNLLSNFEKHGGRKFIRHELDNLQLEHLFRWPVSNEEPIMNIINRLFQKCRVKEYKGQMPSSPTLFLKDSCNVYVSLPGPEEVEMFYELLDKRKERNAVDDNTLEINVCNLPANIFRPLPGDGLERTKYIEIYIPDVRDSRDAENAVAIVRNLKPTYDRFAIYCNLPDYRSINRVHFPRCTFQTAAEIKDVMKRLQEEDVHIKECVSFPKRCCPSEDAEKQELEEIAKDKLKMEYALYWDPDMDNWE